MGGSDIATREPTIFFSDDEVAGPPERRSPLAGFWALLVGGALLLVLTVALRPVTDVRDCSNYGASGNASAFSDDRWDLLYPLLLLGWLCAVVVEQLLPPTWSGRGAGSIVARGLLAVTIALIVSCGVGINLLALCH